MKDFGLHLFTTDLAVAKKAELAGVSGFIVDWETMGKDGRQKGAGLEMNFDSPEDIRALKGECDLPVWCRINSLGPHSEPEVEHAIEAGADLILLPMVETVEEVEGLFGLIRDRCQLGILVETQAAVDLSEELAKLPLSAIYVGLNDLSLDRGTQLFDALVDGTVDRVREAFGEVHFGVAGITKIDGGSPVPARLLAAEFSRLDCNFTFLRRAFKADVPTERIGAEVPLIRQAVLSAATRTAEQVQADRSELKNILKSSSLFLR